MCDPTWEVCNFQKAAPAPAAEPAVNGTAANTTAPAKEGPSQALVTEIAVKFVNAMWATMFARTLSVGLQQMTFSTKFFAASSDSVQGTMTPSVAYKSYTYSSQMLTAWGIYGWTAFLLKRFFKQSDLVKQIAISATKGSALIGLALIGLSAWKTTSRDQCSVNAYWQCWHDASPTTSETWKNGNFKAQSQTSYGLALQMIWLSITTSKYLTADLKFADNKKIKQEKKAKADANAADAAMTNGTTNGTAPAAAQKLFDVMEQISWGL